MWLLWWHVMMYCYMCHASQWQMTSQSSHLHPLVCHTVCLMSHYTQYYTCLIPKVKVFYYNWSLSLLSSTITLGQSKVDTFWIVYGGLMVPGSPLPLWEPPPLMFHQIMEVRFFEKINFLCFFVPKKTFLSPKILIWPQKPHFWGGSYF